MMSHQRTNFESAAANWDEKPRRVKLSHDIGSAIKAAVQLDPELDVFDFGCGTGLLTLQIQPFVRSITGVDSSPAMLDVLKQKAEAEKLTNVDWRCLDVENGDEIAGEYDLIVSAMTFHHIRDVPGLLAQFYRVCRFGATLCVADLDAEDGEFHEDNQGVFHFGFERTAMQQAFANAGFMDTQSLTAAEIEKSEEDGQTRVFTVGLTIGRKPHLSNQG
ncbi:MAG: class I SAM-dependent methyltransferase [Thermodesulfobacteriota bacterium]